MLKFEINLTTKKLFPPDSPLLEIEKYREEKVRVFGFFGFYIFSSQGVALLHNRATVHQQPGRSVQCKPKTPTGPADRGHGKAVSPEKAEKGKSDRLAEKLKPMVKWIFAGCDGIIGSIP